MSMRRRESEMSIRLKKGRAVAVSLIVAIGGCVPDGQGDSEVTAAVVDPTAPAEAARSNGGADPARDWNAYGELAALAVSRPPPIVALDFAILHAAIYDAVLSYDARYQPYLRTIAGASGSQIAAGAKAAHDILVNRFPTQAATIDAQYASYLADNGIAMDDPGVSVGAQAAATMLANRAGDGEFPANPLPWLGSTDPGQWRPTPSLIPGLPPPPFAPGLLPWVAFVRPFTNGGDGAGPQGAPLFSSKKWVAEYNEVKAYGSVDSAVRTAEQTATALLWADNGPLLWQRAMRSINVFDSVVDSAHMYALTDLALADAQIKCWNVKYNPSALSDPAKAAMSFNRWRPITAIRLGDQDDNAETVPDPGWAPLINTPNFPAYISGHATTSGAVTQMLRHIFHSDNVTFTITSKFPLAAVEDRTRTYYSLSAALRDVSDARVWEGIHFRSDDEDGAHVGKIIANHVYDSYLLPAAVGSDCRSRRH